MQCRAVADASARLACYDALVDRLTVREEKPAPREGAPESVPADPTVRLADSEFGRSDADAALREALGAAPPRSITATVRALTARADRRRVIELDNDQVWEEAETSHVSLRPGDAIEIEVGALKAHYLRRVGSGRSVRVKRLR